MTKHLRADEVYRLKFDEAGFSNDFDLLGRDWSSDHGRKCSIRCKRCGAKFETWSVSECFKGRQTRLVCPECGAVSAGADVWSKTKEAKAAISYYTAGHSVRETAEAFCVSSVQINSIVKRAGVHNGRKFQEAYIEDQKKSAERRLSIELLEKGFEYVSGYTGRDGRVRIRCIECGQEFERSVDFCKRGNMVCRECQRRVSECQKREAEKLKAETMKSRETAMLFEKDERIRRKQEELLNLLDSKCHVCIVCGSLFSIRDYMDSCGLKQIQHDPKYCSEACKRKQYNRMNKRCKRTSWKRDSFRHRALKYGCDYDPSVTLRKLIKRDGLRCRLCGEMCDPNDRSWSEWSGPKSPSIDHIIPMSKKGGHTWDNVQVAHIICNSEKGDSYEVV